MNKQQEPRLRFQGFTGEWKTEGFESVGEFNPKAEIPQIFQYVDLESVVGTQLISYREEFKETAPSRAQRLAKNGDLFFQAVRPYQKNNYLFEKNNENFVFSTGYIQIRPQNDGYFLLTLVQKEEFVQEVLLRCTGTSYPAINTSSLQNIAILIPQTVEEQTHLGLFFRRLDSQIAESRAVLEKSRQLKKAMLAKMFPENGEKIPKIRFKGFEEEWEEKKLGEVVQRITRKNTNLDSLLPLTISAQNGLIAQTEFFDNQVAGKNLTGYYLIENGEFAYNKSYSNGYPWGAIKRLDRHKNGVLSTLYILFKPAFASSQYLVSYFDGTNWHGEVASIAGEGARNHGLLNIPVHDFFEIKILLPCSLQEQTAIGNFFRQLDETIALQSAEVEKLNQLKKGLLAAMLV